MVFIVGINPEYLQMNYTCQ